MTDIEFTPWPKTPRLLKENMVITEKIDGTNAAIGVIEYDMCGPIPPMCRLTTVEQVCGEDRYYLVYAQSRSRIIAPADFWGKGADNYGFADWVWSVPDELVSVLGPGLHFGEWWGHGILRGYDQPAGVRHFSLFNTSRWGHLDNPDARAAIRPPEALTVVPVLAVNTLDTAVLQDVMEALRFTGSHAAPGYENPEGVCVYLPSVQRTLKLTFNAQHKGTIRPHKLDMEGLAKAELAGV